MTPMTELVQRMEDLVKAYGADTVQNALTFVTTFTTQVKFYRVGNADGSVLFDLTIEQYERIRDVYWSNTYMSTDGKLVPNKIQAIKLLREITACGLKEAKDVVENTAWVYR